jgi:pimeloyl-ACP methyl ester carboxylesterase
MPAPGLRFLEAVPPPNVRPRGALILLHAFPLNAYMWERQLELASRGWRIIAPHYRGIEDPRSPTPKPGGGGHSLAATVDDQAADVIDLLDSLHIEDAVIGGLSMGGYVAFAMFRRAPTYFRGLVLADTRSQADTPEGREGRTKMLDLVHARGPEAVADDMLPKLLGATTHATRPTIVAVVRSMILSNTSEWIANAIRVLMSRPDSTPILTSVHVPTLIIVGEEDVLTPVSAAEEMHSRIAGSDLVRIPAAGHLPNLEQPDAFDAALARFLDHRV